MTDLKELRKLLELEHEYVLNDLNEPKFEYKTRVHDWRNYVPEPLQKCWHALSVEARLVVYAMAEQQANAENWD